MTNREKLAALATKKNTKLLEQAKWHKENRAWLRKSQAIALQILKALDNQNLTQKQLADRLNLSPQVVSKWVKGQENFTLETISKLEDALGIKLVEFAEPQRRYEHIVATHTFKGESRKFEALQASSWSNSPAHATIHLSAKESQSNYPYAELYKVA